MNPLEPSDYYPITAPSGAPTSATIVTLAEVKERLRIADDAEDTSIQSILNGAVARVSEASGIPARVGGVRGVYGDTGLPVSKLRWDQVETISIDSVTDPEGTALSFTAQQRDHGRWLITLASAVCGSGTLVEVNATVGLQAGQRLDLFKAAVTAAAIADYDHPAAGQTDRVFSNPAYTRALSLLRSSRL